MRILMAFALAVGVVAAAPGAPAEAASCYLQSCNGVDPQASGCSADAVTVPGYSITVGGKTITLRHSAKCNATWARIWTPADSCPYDKTLHLRVFAPGASSPHWATYSYITCGPAYSWTAMWGSRVAGYNPDYVQACLAWGVTVQNPAQECTGKW